MRRFLLPLLVGVLCLLPVQYASSQQEGGTEEFNAALLESVEALAQVTGQTVEAVYQASIAQAPVEWVDVHVWAWPTGIVFVLGLLLMAFAGLLEWRRHGGSYCTDAVIYTFWTGVICVLLAFIVGLAGLVPETIEAIKANANPPYYAMVKVTDMLASVVP